MKNSWSVCFCLAASFTAMAQPPGGGPGGPGGGPGRLASLKTARLPQPTGVAGYVQDNVALVALGKALFWDVQAGSDGRTACGSCHFHAGADHRNQNVLSGAAGTVNYKLQASDFPFHQLSDPNNNRSAVVRDQRQVAGSIGVVHRAFQGLDATGSSAAESGGNLATNFSVQGVVTRQATGRNAGSTINAVFNYRNFWDGRASTLFTGATPFGSSDTGLNVYLYQNQQLTPAGISMQNASLASQGTGPILSEVEMSYAGRTWADLGRKLLNAQPLAFQSVAADDSVLGALANPSGEGLSTTYAAMIQRAFRAAYWNAPSSAVNSAGYNQMEANFNLFWALAIQAYESTLISDNTRLDQFLEGNAQALTQLEQQGLRVFQSGNSNCAVCHGGPELTAASYTAVLGPAGGGAGGNNTPAALGFFRTGVTPIGDDLGLGGTDSFGQPFFTGNRPGIADGTFKSPGLRNVELTGPYFHDGGQATLEQVVDFYGRNGDFPQGGNLGPGIGRIRLSQQDKTSLVAFMKALTDDRVKYERAPFDHPSVCIPVGAAEAAPGVLQVDPSEPGVTALDRWALIPASGKGGLSVPLQTFDELLSGIGNDGSRAHTLTDSCTPPGAARLQQ